MIMLRKRKVAAARCCCCVAVAAPDCLTAEPTLGPWLPQTVPATGHTRHLVCEQSRRLEDLLKLKRGSIGGHHPEERRRLMNRPPGLFQRAAGRLNNSATSSEYRFSHLRPQDYIGSYRRSCSSTSSQLIPSSNNSGSFNRRTQTIRERIVDRPSAEVNYIVFECPTRNDVSLSYRPLLIARGGGVTGQSNVASKLLAEYWSSSASTVESIMKVKGNGATTTNGYRNGEGERQSRESSIKPLQREEQQPQEKTISYQNKPDTRPPLTSIIDSNVNSKYYYHSSKLDCPVFITDESPSSSSSNSSKKLVHHNVYCNPFEYSKTNSTEGTTGDEETETMPKASGRLLAARMRAISDSGMSTNDDDICDVLQSKSLLKAGFVAPPTQHNLQAVSSKEQIIPSNSLPNFLDTNSLSRSRSLIGGGLTQPIGYCNRDLLYVGVEPKLNSATRHQHKEEIVATSVSARVKHRLTLGDMSAQQSSSHGRRHSGGLKGGGASGSYMHKRRHTGCFKKSLSRRMSSAEKWMCVENSASKRTVQSSNSSTVVDIASAE